MIPTCEKLTGIYFVEPVVKGEGGRIRSRFHGFAASPVYQPDLNCHSPIRLIKTKFQLAKTLVYRPRRRDGDHRAD